MPYDPQPLPELQHADLRPYVPALRHAAELIREEAERLEERFEVTELELVGRTRAELHELRQLIETGET